MKIVFIGPRGSGKSKISTILSNQLGLPVFSTDERVEKAAGQTISEIVATFGWERFREIEAEVVEAVAKKDHCVIDTGGGAILDPNSRQLLAENAFVIYLCPSIEALERRVGRRTHRPSLTNQADAVAEMAKIATEREPLYLSMATFSIDNSERPPDETVRLIRQRLDQKTGGDPI